jgi:hypothetical protein
MFPIQSLLPNQGQNIQNPALFNNFKIGDFQFPFQSFPRVPFQIKLPFPLNSLELIKPTSFSSIGTIEKNLNLKFLEKFSEFLEDLQQCSVVNKEPVMKILTEVRDTIKNQRLNTINDLKVSLLDHIEFFLNRENISEKEINLLYVFRGLFSFFFLNDFQNKDNNFKNVIIGFLKEISTLFSLEEMSIDEKIFRLNSILTTVSFLETN